jgi:hypothetical protein|tara:strand:+ start:1411 stop:2007 length:597 start_codon:yes stop_codon:yes gene_type:complete
MGNTQSTFKELTSINVRDKVEKKGRFDYLSWAYAWAIVKDKYPSANRTVYESDHTGLNYFTDGNTGYVKVGITINDVEHIDYLPIMGHNNQSLSVDKISSFAVNKTIQRSTVKAIAMHGLGLSLWAGEDLADISETAPKKVTTSEKKPTLKKTHAKWNDVVNFVKSNKKETFASTIAKVEQKFTLSVAIKKDLSNYAK